MKQRMLSAVMALVMLVALLPVPASAADQIFSGTCGESITWQLNAATGELTISGVGEMPDYTYSETAPWYPYRSRIFTVVLTGPAAPDDPAPDTDTTDNDPNAATTHDKLTAIGDYAFYECNRLTSIDATDSAISSIGKSAMEYCTLLTDVKLPEEPIYLGERVFEGCTSLAGIDFPAGLTHVGSRAFCGCTALTAIDLQELTGGIDAYAFYNCTALAEIKLPAGLTALGDSAFSGCTALASITLPEQLVILNSFTFAGCTALQSVTLPRNLRSIGTYCFADCQALTEISFPATLASLDRFSFSDAGLTRAVFAGDVPEMAAADSLSATFPAQTVLAHPYGAEGWSWPLYKGYETERIYTGVSDSYTDLETGSWYIPFVQHVMATGLMNGTSDTTFRPAANMTRGQLVTVLYRIAGAPETDAQNIFTDVPETEYYFDAVRWAYDNEIVNGVTATEFRPNQQITREQLCVFLYRYAKLCQLPTDNQGELSAFTDEASIMDYAREAVAWCVAEGIINGLPDGRMKPQGSAIRAQVAKVLTVFDELRCRQEILAGDSWMEQFPDEEEPDNNPEEDEAVDIDREDPLYLYGKQILETINAARAERDLAPFTWSDKLYQASAVRAQEITQPDCFLHTRPDGTSYPTVLDEFEITYAARNELIAHGYDSAEGLVDVWMRTPSTGSVMVAQVYEKAAVGVARNSAGKYYYALLLIG